MVFGRTPGTFANYWTFLLNKLTTRKSDTESWQTDNHLPIAGNPVKFTITKKQLNFRRGLFRMFRFFYSRIYLTEINGRALTGLILVAGMLFQPKEISYIGNTCMRPLTGEINNCNKNWKPHNNILPFIPCRQKLRPIPL
jgi:hypothetical protein